MLAIGPHSLAELRGKNVRMAQLAGKKDDDPAAPHGAIPGNSESSADHASRGGKTVKSATPLDAVSVSLRQAYESTLQEAIPDSFMDLLNKLD